MKTSTEILINEAIDQGNIKNIRKCFQDLDFLLFDFNANSKSLPVFLCNLLNKEKFLNLGGAIYILSISLQLLDKTPKEQQKKYFEFIIKAHEKFQYLNIDFIKNLIQQEAINKQSIPLNDSLAAIQNKIVGMKNLSEEYFVFILGLFDQTKFLENDESWKFLSLLQTEWDKLSLDQKDRLFLKLENIYGKSKNWMCDFVITELLGTYFSDERAFQVLSRLSKIKNEESRALIPHGLEHIIKDSKNNELSKRAYQLLVQMQLDTSEQVRDEVVQSLQQLELYKIKLD